jgi:hypothetical protein
MILRTSVSTSLRRLFALIKERPRPMLEGFTGFP